MLDGARGETQRFGDFRVSLALPASEQTFDFTLCESEYGLGFGQ